MSETPAGWHPDPHVPGQQRFWDGAEWTDQVAPHTPTTGPSTTQDPPTTPDGQELAGWGRRVAAAMIDWVVVTPIGIALAWPFLRHAIGVYLDFFDEVVEASETGASPPSGLDLVIDTYLDLVAVSLTILLVELVYVVGFHAWKQATIGKLVVGTRVRLRDRPGPLPMRTILRRWVAQHGPSVVGVIPIVGSATGTYSLVDAIWPLWDENRQSLHDKFAGTNVVVHRRD